MHLSQPRSPLFEHSHATGELILCSECVRAAVDQTLAHTLVQVPAVMSENGFSRGLGDRRTDETPVSHTCISSSGLLELHRRCFSCCNVVLRQEASLAQNQKRSMVRGFERMVGSCCYCHTQIKELFISYPDSLRHRARVPKIPVPLFWSHIVAAVHAFLAYEMCCDRCVAVKSLSPFGLSAAVPPLPLLPVRLRTKVHRL